MVRSLGGNADAVSCIPVLRSYRYHVDWCTLYSVQSTVLLCDRFGNPRYRLYGSLQKVRFTVAGLKLAVVPGYEVPYR
jgi:hypothetical protein